MMVHKNVWTDLDSISYIVTDGFNAKPSILAFDFDSTLFVTKSGKKFPINDSDVEPLNMISIDSIKKYTDTHSIIIISNQGGIETKKQTLEQVKHRILLGIKYLSDNEIPTMTIFSTLKDNYRKPHTYMWRFVLNQLGHDADYIDNPDIQLIDRDYLYVGDAAGREKSRHIIGITQIKKDFSMSDKLFANNCRIRFNTPERFEFNNKYCEKLGSHRYMDRIFGDYKSSLYPIRNWLKNYEESKTEEFNLDDMGPNDEIELLLMMGYPGCGKSTLAKKISEKYGHKIICMDVFKSRYRCYQLTQHHLLKKKRSVIIDNTNPSILARENYIKIATEKDIKVRLIWLNISQDMAWHLNKMRTELTGKKSVPLVAYHRYKKNLQPPDIEEGIDTIIELPFCPNFTDDTLSAFLMEYI